MYALPVNDAEIILIDDAPGEDWIFRYVQFDPLTWEAFSAPHGGQIMSATVNPESYAAWIVASGRLFASSRELKVAVPLPLPVDGLVPFGVTLLDGRYYVCGDASNVWYYDVANERWVVVTQPDPRPDVPDRSDSESTEDYIRRTSPPAYEYARNFPDMYCAFRVGRDHYFGGALGKVTRLRGDRVEEEWIDSGVRFLHGFEEDGDAILCGSDPVGEIYRGNIDTGFERIFQNDDRAIHLTARYAGQRFIGAAIDPDYDGPGLFLLQDDELVPVETGCSREPGALQSLVVKGSALWATDDEGVFRLADGDWSLVDFAQLDQP